jgi:hypothetical protein
VPSLDSRRRVLQSRVPLWAALLVGTLGLILVFAIWHSLGRTNSPEVRRWAGGGKLEETRAFSTAMNHAEDSGWQSGPRKTDEGAPANAPLDYAFPRVTVYSVPNIHPAHNRPTLRDLGDRAQVRAIDAIENASGSKSRPWDDLQKTLSDEDEPGEKDPFVFERVLVATIAKGVEWPPGDRMVWTRIFVQPINFRFTAYTIAATDNETVKVSSVEATNVRKISADIGLTIPGMAGSKVGLSPDAESTVKTTSDVSTQYERLGVDITPEFLRIIRESSSGGDVGGNTTVALSVVTDPELITTQSPDSPPPESAINLVVTGLHLEEVGKTDTMDVVPLAPLPHCALRAKVSAVYEQRHIEGGREFYDESRQNVVFIHDVDYERTVELIGADDVSPFIWRIQLVPKNLKPSNEWKDRRALNAKFNDSGSWRQLIFSDYGRAVKLAHWVRTHPIADHLSGYQFNWTPDMGLTVVKESKDACKVKVNQPVPEPESQPHVGPDH